MNDDPEEFKRRLNDAADSNPDIKPLGKGRYTDITERMRDEGAAVSTQAIQKWFTGETLPARKWIRPLAKVVGVTESYLLGTGAVASREKLASYLAKDVAAHAMILAGLLRAQGKPVAVPSDGSCDLMTFEGTIMQRIHVLPVALESKVKGSVVFPQQISLGADTRYISVATAPGSPTIAFDWPLSLLQKVDRRKRSVREMHVGLTITQGSPRVTCEKISLRVI